MQPSGDFQLSIGYWIVSHRNQLRKWWVLALLGFIAVSLTWGIIFFGVFVSQQRQIDAAILHSAAGLQGLQPSAAVAPQPLLIEDVGLITRNTERADLVGWLRNPNADWGAAQVTVHFSVGSQTIGSQTVFVNPDSLRPVVQLNVPLPAEGDRRVQLTVDQTDWRRASAAVLPAPNFATEQVILQSTAVTAGGRSFLTLNVRGALVNRSVYSFLQVMVPLIVRDGERVVAVDELRLDRWLTLETKTVNHTWTYPIGSATAADLSPQVSQFDANNLFR